MIDLDIQKGKLELVQYTGDTTLQELLEATELFVAGLRKKSVQCRLCGECCHRPPVLGLDIKLLAANEGVGIREWAASNLLPPELPDLAARRKGIAELLSQTELSELEATVLYEYNQSEPVTFKHNEADRCFFQKGSLCGNYGLRPFVCRLYLCRFGEKLQDLQEMIVTQGTWHAYALLGAVPMEEIPHNPFLKAPSYRDVRLKEFEFGLEKAIGELFSFF
jgi:Fe-S-cluster containining protein